MLTKGGKLQTVLDRFRKQVIDGSKKQLKTQKKNVGGKLSNSLKSELKVFPNSFSLSFLMEEYGYYQDRGVKGKTSSYPEISRYGTLAKFGSGKGKKGGLTEGIKKWVKAKRFQFQDKETKRFLSYNSTAFLITRSIWNKGLKPSLFFTKPFEKAFKQLPDDVINAYALEVEEFLKFSFQEK
tara:strand:- start:6631 stop:7176 length:546 start_codon:yes stop_codon:yes gene_type:complete